MHPAPQIEVRHKLLHLARNHRWTWHPATAALLAGLPGASPDVHPVATVLDMDDAGWQAVLDDATTVATIERLHHDLTVELEATPTRAEIAYVSAEFGISELVPQYSGGLGVLAGDHLKAASDLRIPLVGVGLLYRQGFFRQEIEDNAQVERYETYDPERLGFVDTGTIVRVDVGDEPVDARIWRFSVGLVDLYALDTDVPSNDDETRSITDRLYSGDSEHRIRQEIVLGVGGLRALRAIGLDPTIVHLNEGHAGFWLLEKLATEMAAGADLERAIEVTRAGAVFTTHTPVPAGIDRFDRSSIEPYMRPWSEATGVPLETLYELATSPDDEGTPKPFNMAVLCLALTAAGNGVSKLHGEVSRELFGSVPDGPAIGSITNGVHARTWVTPELAAVFDDTLGRSWDLGQDEAWSRAPLVDNDRIVEVRRSGRQRLLEVIEATTGSLGALDPDALTIGFARRFATYKRADLMLTEAARLAQLLADDSRPIQFVFAGKAHPADVPGKALTSKVLAFSASPEANGRFVFIPDYEMGIARAMYGGCDVWLNNPIRPHEASGTSGEKSALNGGLQCSILDGWWDEMYDGANGWAIATSDDDEPEIRDKFEAASIYGLLETEILPLFYAGSGRPTAAWLDMVKHNWLTLGPKVTAARMVADYDREVYRPAIERARSIG